MTRASHADSKALAKTESSKVAAKMTAAAKTLVTGATGFLGAHLLRLLAANGEGGAKRTTTARLRVLTQAESAPRWACMSR